MDFYAAVAARRSVRAFRKDPIPDDVFQRVMDAARLAPSAKNIQPWVFVTVTDPATIADLATACKNQQFIAQAPIIICGCVRESICYRGMGGYWNSWAVDLAIAFEHIMLAATAEGLGTCWIGSFLEAEVRRILQVPEDVRIAALTPLGFPAETPRPRPRKPLARILSANRYVSPPED